MKLIELFNKDMTPNWAKIFSIDQFKAMLETPQSKDWHKEGNVAIHTQNVTKNMQDYLDNVLCVTRGSDYYKMMMCAAICHDLGKTTTTKFNEKTQDYTCKYHGLEGDKICRLLFWDDPDIELREKVCYMVRHHMDVFYLNKDDELYKRTMRMSWGYVPVKDMCILNYCDATGSVNDFEDSEAVEKRLMEVKRAAEDMKCFHSEYVFDTNKQKLNFFYNQEEAVQIKNKSTLTVYIMVGIAGAGKDTWIAKNKPELPVLCRDTIRTEIGLKGDKPFGTPEQENDVTRIFNERMMQYCSENKSFIINNTNIKKMRRDELIKQMLKYNPKIVMVYVEAPSIKELKERRKGQIKPSVISRMAHDLEFPEKYEYNELIIHKQYGDKEYKS